MTPNFPGGALPSDRESAKRPEGTDGPTRDGGTPAASTGSGETRRPSWTDQTTNSTPGTARPTDTSESTPDPWNGGRRVDRDHGDVIIVTGRDNDVTVYVDRDGSGAPKQSTPSPSRSKGAPGRRGKKHSTATIIRPTSETESATPAPRTDDAATPGGEIPGGADGPTRERQDDPSPRRTPKPSVLPTSPRPSTWSEQTPGPSHSSRPSSDAPTPDDTTQAPTSSPAPRPATPSTSQSSRPRTDPAATSDTTPAPPPGPATSDPTPPRAPAPSGLPAPSGERPSAEGRPEASGTASHAPVGTTGTASPSTRRVVTGPVASRPAPSDPPGHSPTAQGTVRLDKPTPWASGQVTDAEGFSRARANARTAGDDTHLVEVSLPGRSWTELHPNNALLRAAGSSTARVVVDVPLSVDGASLGETSAGAHDTSWRAFGQALGSTGRTSVVRLRLPEGGNPDRAKLAFRRASQVLREANPLVKVEWAAPVGTDPRTAAATFPGADAVDIIGLQVPGSGTWTSVLADDGGLLDWADWASRTGRPVALHWQLSQNTDTGWVRNLNSWIQVLVAQRRMSYETMAQVGTPTAEVIATYRALW